VDGPIPALLQRMAALHSTLETSKQTEPYRTHGCRRRGCNRNIVLPGQTVFVSVRVVRRHYLLKPDAALGQAILYVMRHYAEKWAQQILGFCFMSNHFHVVLRDPLGIRPKFFADFHRSLAQVVKDKYGWSGSVFTKLSPPVVLHSAFAVADKIAYTLANPVAAGAVRYPRDWPGLTSRISDMGRKVYRAKRPEYFFGLFANLTLFVNVADKARLPRA
jgi:putative transposase